MLSSEISDGKFYFQGCSNSDWPEQLWDTLRSRFEISGMDQQALERLTVENVVNQAILDATILLKQYGVKRVPNNLQRVHYLLKKHSLHSEPEE